MNSDKILLDKEKKEDVATFVTGAISSHLTAAGFDIKDWSLELEDSNETDLVMSGEVGKFRLDIGPRDEIEMQLAVSLNSKKTGKVLWSGVVTEKDDKYAGVMGNSRKTIAGYITKTLRTVINKTLKEVNESIQTAVITGIKDMTIPEGVGRLVIRTEPPRAEVYTGAIYHGMSPLSIYLEPGISEVTFRLKGFKEMREKVSIRNRDVTEIDRILEKE
ncbi:MAG: PEGA domain-containing protein [Deltaproteobacteria bacterium]|nr:PEGA domain-containing protein [Deltaproteobacteria bacterium]